MCIRWLINHGTDYRMRLCTFTRTEEVDSSGLRRFRCTRCKYISTFIPDKGQPIYRQCNPEGWGDKLARWLSYVGITQARFAAVVGNCGCAARQEELNHVGWQLSNRWAAIVKSLGSWLRPSDV